MWSLSRRALARAARRAAVVLAGALAACAPETAAPPAAPPAVTPPPPAASPLPAARWDGRHADAAAWTRLTMDALDTAPASALLAATPADAAAFCPRYGALDRAGRQAVWTFVLSAMSEFESDFNPALTYTESFPDSSGRPVISRGLLQLSFESANGYGCAVPAPEALHDPAVNLRCGARILARWVERDGRIGGTAATPARGGGRYWSVLRPGRPRQPLETIRARTAELPICRTG